MNKKMNQKKQNRMAVRQAAAKAVLRDEQNRRIQFAATNPEGEVMKNLRTTLRGLDEDAVTASRAKYGSNKVTHEKKKSLAQRLAGAFVNPFTAILFCLALVSTMTDMVFPYFSLQRGQAMSWTMTAASRIYWVPASSPSSSPMVRA